MAGLHIVLSMYTLAFGVAHASDHIISGHHSEAQNGVSGGHATPLLPSTIAQYPLSQVTPLKMKSAAGTYQTV